jgi:hypothetical protein
VIRACCGAAVARTTSPNRLRVERMSASVPRVAAGIAMMQEHRSRESRRQPMTARHPLPDEPVQIVTIAATAGTFTLTYSGQETGPLAWDLAAGDLRDALEALGRIGAGNVAVSGSDGGPFELRFGGALAGRIVDVVEPDDGLLDGSVEVTTLVPSPWE